MGLLNKEEFVCIDCETTGLDTENDVIIEVALVRFTLQEIFHSFSTLVDPGRPIPEASMKIHHIKDDMVKGQPLIEEVLPHILENIGNKIVVGHGVKFDLQMLDRAAARAGLPSKLIECRTFDTLRLARYYGESPVNSLESLRCHFNIADEGAHRALNDVMVNIEVFKKLVLGYKTSEEITELLSKPVLMKTMPLGKYKGRIFKEIPENYLQWASHQEFDQDLLYSIRTELKRRKKTVDFARAANPFSSL